MKTLILCISLCAFLCPQDVCAQDYRLGSGDSLRVTVFREDELNREVSVSSGGTFSFPMLGSIRAEGLTVAELEGVITDGLKKYLKGPQVNIFITQYSTITVSGEVNNPGSFPLIGDLTVLKAVSLAGGFTKLAAPNRVKIMRFEDGRQKTIRVKVAALMSKGDKSKDIPLRRGDIVVVPESLF